MKILFVCLGNICRSPTAEGIFRQLLEARGLDQQILVDSCGTGDWHKGSAPDGRAQAAALQRGIDISGLRARALMAEDFERFDYILAMDAANLEAVNALKPEAYSGHTGLLLDFSDTPGASVPDPYFGGEDGFETVLNLIGGASSRLLDSLLQTRPS